MPSIQQQVTDNIQFYTKIRLKYLGVKLVIFAIIIKIIFISIFAYFLYTAELSFIATTPGEIYAKQLLDASTIISCVFAGISILLIVGYSIMVVFTNYKMSDKTWTMVNSWEYTMLGIVFIIFFTICFLTYYASGYIKEGPNYETSNKYAYDTCIWIGTIALLCLTHIIFIIAFTLVWKIGGYTAEKVYEQGIKMYNNYNSSPPSSLSSSSSPPSSSSSILSSSSSSPLSPSSSSPLSSITTPYPPLLSLNNIDSNDGPNESINNYNTNEELFSNNVPSTLNSNGNNINNKNTNINYNSKNSISGINTPNNVKKTQ